MQDLLVVHAAHGALHQNEWTAEQHAVVLEHFQRLLNKTGGALALRFVIGRLNVRVLLVEEGVTGAEGKGHRDEEEYDVHQEDALPQGVRLARCLLVRLQFTEFAPQVPYRDAAVDNAQDAKAVEHQQTKLLVALRHSFQSSDS